jgi:ubiquinone/menaquinone biosynthesis C-methylase UbiE
MRVETNRWNRLRYTLWAPLYDVVASGFEGRRRHSLRLLAPRPGERIIIVGAGTGADLPHLPSGARVLATDLTPAMLARARPRLRDGMRAAVMDAQQLGVVPGSFDAAVLHLILSVVADPVRCLQEAERALRPSGRMVVFDKFVRGPRPSALLRLVNLVARPLFTDMTRNFEEILRRSGARLLVVHDAPGVLGGLYRHLLLRKAG